eukprot:TRINITY_DN12758_c0_g1_i1.p1 TRINITY_DN12758_c0_g1~~TRINITY_DN12758_c0_g1_i1.p1  ORF type:complete len:371 (-),score=47.40 TRINITY_DN12758_c0_g1_i1:123-1235(-)
MRKIIEGGRSCTPKSEGKRVFPKEYSGGSSVDGRLSQRYFSQASLPSPAGKQRQLRNAGANNTETEVLTFKLANRTDIKMKLVVKVNKKAIESFPGIVPENSKIRVRVLDFIKSAKPNQPSITPKQGGASPKTKRGLLPPTPSKSRLEGSGVYGVTREYYPKEKTSSYPSRDEKNEPVLINSPSAFELTFSPGQSTARTQDIPSVERSMQTRTITPNPLEVDLPLESLKESPLETDRELPKETLMEALKEVPAIKGRQVSSILTMDSITTPSFVPPIVPPINLDRSKSTPNSNSVTPLLKTTNSSGTFKWNSIYSLPTFQRGLIYRLARQNMQKLATDAIDRMKRLTKAVVLIKVMFQKYRARKNKSLNS